MNQSVERNPKMSVRRRSHELGLSMTSVHRILKQDLKLKPYHISVHQGISQTNADQRKAMCTWFLEKLDENGDFLRNVWFSDEAHFYVSGHVNSRNYRSQIESYETNQSHPTEHVPACSWKCHSPTANVQATKRQTRGASFKALNGGKPNLAHKNKLH